MDVDESPPSQSYTILRIKRKRNEEPLDALRTLSKSQNPAVYLRFVFLYLVIESTTRRKKSRGGVGIFRFAQTVEHDAWDDEKRQRDIHVRSCCLLRLSDRG